MKVILLQDVPGLGRKLDVKQVKNGYAGNFLIPRKLAKMATDKELKELEVQKAVKEKQEEDLRKKMEALAKELPNEEFRFKVKTGEKGEIFTSVNAEDIKKSILEKVQDKDLNIEVKLSRPIKAIGKHEVEVDLSRGIKTKTNVFIEKA